MIIASKMLTENELMDVVKRIHANHRFQYLLLEKYSDIELDFYNDNFNLKHCYRGRFFGENTGVQFRLKGKKYLVLLISDETKVEGSENFEPVCGIEHYKKRPQSVYLWGSTLDELLFRINLGVQSNFDGTNFSDDLRQQFEENGISLSQNATISVQKASSKWFINDTENQDTYIVQKKGNMLEVYFNAKAWYQLRIPKLLHYPIEQANPSLINIKLKVQEYHRNGVVEFVRFVGFQQVDERKQKEETGNAQT